VPGRSAEEAASKPPPDRVAECSEKTEMDHIGSNGLISLELPNNKSGGVQFPG